MSAWTLAAAAVAHPALGPSQATPLMREHPPADSSQDGTARVTRSAMDGGIVVWQCMGQDKATPLPVWRSDRARL